ncbi:LysR family transcriptional regulator [Verticiella sediminum]|uniref:LysR family transcriptional regulator n=1 Tax=Verticiella sediminum TaxID=1247510 RepID=A0A556AJG0_9BURK|nr:LysR family transcriptional regulator [Verticiella sediminum]TSH92995.1 LysR family transcriptional regulator [Verticiella sediminum]
MSSTPPTPFLGTRTAAESALEDMTSLRIFVKSVELGNFSEVARRLGVTPAAVSKRVASLEARLNQRLLNRNTRGLFATEAGQRLYERCVRALDELDAAAAELADAGDKPSGHLRITAPLLLGSEFIGPYVPAFLQDNPGLSLDLNFSISRLDLFQERIDIAVRIAERLEEGLIAIELAPYRRLFCAAPGYLAKHGAPGTPSDLVRHNCLVSRGTSPNRAWPFRQDGDVGHVMVSGTLCSDNSHTVRACAEAGLGIMMAPLWLVHEALQAGRLVPVLPDHAPPDRAVYAVLLQRSDKAPKLAAAVGFLRACLARLPR